MVGGGGIRSCDLRFIRRGSQPIELPLGDKTRLILQEITIHLFFFFLNKIKLTSILIPKRIIICISNLGRVNNTCVRFAGGIKN
jgi:hypothetical protein